MVHPPESDHTFLRLAGRAVMVCRPVTLFAYHIYLFVDRYGGQMVKVFIGSLWRE